MPKKPIWDLKKIKKGLDIFYKKNKRYPTATEFDESEDLPSSRQIQRSFGGLINLRKELALSGQHDLTKGAHSSKRAVLINSRAHKLEQEVHNYLIKVFGVQFVHREFFFTDDHRTRTDFFIYYKDGYFSIDVFFAKDRHNLIGCLNSKLRKFEPRLMLEYPVIFLQMNDEISEDIMNDVVRKKKNKLGNKQYLMNMEQVKAFCKDKNPQKLSK